MVTGNAEKKTTGSGGVVILRAKASAQLNLYGGTLRQAAENTGVIHMLDGSAANHATVNMYGGTVTGGKASGDGGNVYVGKYTAFNMYGGNIFAYIKDVPVKVTLTNVTLTDGVAGTDGGNIFLENGELIVTGGTVSGGAANGGANILLSYDANMTMDGTTVENGVANARGGNIRVNQAGASASIRNAIISGGSATYGGNLCVFLAAEATVENTTFTGGTATECGGNIAVERQASLSMTGCTVTGGDVPTGSDEMGFGGSIFVDNTAKLSITGGSVTGGKSRFGGALAVCSTGGVTVTGADITSGIGNNGTAIYVASGCGLTLTDTTVTGSGTGTTVWNRGVITMAGTVKMPDPEFDLMIDCRYGESYIDIEALTSVGEAPISVRRWAVDTTDDDMGLLAIHATEEQLGMFEARKNEFYKVSYDSGTLVLTADHAVFALNDKGAIVLAADSLTDAMSAEATYYVLYSSLDGQTVSKNILLDLNGQTLTNVTIPADITVQLIDSATDDFAGVYGSVAGTIEGTVETPVSFGGKTYLVVCEDGAYSAHCYEVKLTHVSLDASNDALGYKAQLFGDEVVMAHVTGFGFDLWVDGGSVKTYSKTGSATLTLRLKNIMAAGGGEMNINANAFVTFDVSDEKITSPDHTTTMKDAIVAVNALTDLSDAQKAAVYGLYEQYSELMDSWLGETNNIKTWAPAAEEA